MRQTIHEEKVKCKKALPPCGKGRTHNKIIEQAASCGPGVAHHHALVGCCKAATPSFIIALHQSFRADASGAAPGSLQP